MQHVAVSYFWNTATLCVTLSAWFAAPTAPGTVCRTPDQQSAALVRWVKRIAAGTDPAAVRTRGILKIPQVDSTEVRYIVEEPTCRQALGPYSAVTGMSDATTGKAVEPSGQLYVAQAGSVYVVLDPVKTAGEFSVIVTMDAAFQVLASGLH